MSRIRKPSAGLFVATVALVAATSGSAVAASLITSKQIKNGTIQTKDISKKARTALKGNLGLRGLPGANGANGANGATGAQGPAGPVNLKYVVGTTVDTLAAGQFTATADCPTGQSVVGGGVISSDDVVEIMQVNSTYPTDGADTDEIPDDGWGADVDVNDATAHSITAYAICTTATAIS